MFLHSKDISFFYKGRHTIVAPQPEDLTLVIDNLKNDIFDKRNFDYDSFSDKYSHVRMLRNLLLSYQNNEGDSPSKESELPPEVCEACECTPCDCGWGN